jgi:RNA polymerase sigma factor (sigma-70 family)
MLSDRELWENFVSGDEEAFKVLYEKYVVVLIHYGNRFSKNEELVRDSVQDLFIDLYRYRTKLKMTDKILPYLMVSLKRVLVRRLRKEGVLIYTGIEKLPYDYLLKEVESAWDHETEYDFLQDAMDRLTSRQREAVYLKYVTGLSYEDISMILDINYQSARNIIYRAVQSLRDMLLPQPQP